MQSKRINKELGSEEESGSLDKLRESLSEQAGKVINTEVSKEDRIVRLVVTMDQFCGCGGSEDVEVNRTVPWDSELQDGDKVQGFDESDEILRYL